jgi:hypothetical protein
MKKTRMVRITVTSSLNEISTDRWKRWWGGGGCGRCYYARTHPSLHQASEQIFKDDVNGVSSFGYLLFAEVHGYTTADAKGSVLSIKDRRGLWDGKRSFKADKII